MIRVQLNDELIYCDERVPVYLEKFICFKISYKDEIKWAAEGASLDRATLFR